jgi:hypothetical protein
MTSPETNKKVLYKIVKGKSVVYESNDASTAIQYAIDNEADEVKQEKVR